MTRFRQLSKNHLLAALMIASAMVLIPVVPTFAQAPSAAGIDEVDVVHETATVEKLDLEKRKVTLKFADGKSKTIKVDKSVRNLDQVKVGDKLKMSYTEEIIVVIGKTGETPGAAAAGVVGVAPKGAKPGAFMVDTMAMSAKVVSVDPAKYRIVLKEANGKNKTVKVSKKVKNLDKLKAGDSVDIAVTEELAVEVVK